MEVEEEEQRRRGGGRGCNNVSPVLKSLDGLSAGWGEYIRLLFIVVI